MDFVIYGWPDQFCGTALKEKLGERCREKAISHMTVQGESVDFKGLEISHTLICTLDKQWISLVCCLYAKRLKQKQCGELTGYMLHKQAAICRPKSFRI